MNFTMDGIPYVGSGTLIYIKHDEGDKDIAKMTDVLGEIFILTCAHNVVEK